jgi:hypothetical protein
MMEPLQTLLRQNVQEAMALALLDLPPLEAHAALAAIDAEWAVPNTEVARFDRASSVLGSKIHRGTVTLSSYRDTSIEITRVFPIRDISYLFADLARPLRTPLTSVLEPILEKILSGCKVALKDRATAAEAKAIDEGNAQISSGLNTLRSHICAVGGAPIGLSVFAKVLVAPGRACWIGLPPKVSVESSQYWRDRLGLEHYPFREGGDRPLTLGDRLVRVTFSANTSAHVLPRFGAQDMLKRFPEDLWVVRPTVFHQGNMRFMQKHTGDAAHAAVGEGSTIDIKDVRYEQGERELILMFGAEARLTWFDAVLMDGVPLRQLHDLDHLGFVQAMGRRFGW